MTKNDMFTLKVTKAHNKQKLSWNVLIQSTNPRELIALDRQGTQQQRPESPAVTLTWYASNYKIHKLHQRCIPSASAVPIAFPDGCYQRGVMIVIIVLIPCSWYTPLYAGRRIGNICSAEYLAVGEACKAMFYVRVQALNLRDPSFDSSGFSAERTFTSSYQLTSSTVVTMYPLRSRNNITTPPIPFRSLYSVHPCAVVI